VTDTIRWSYDLLSPGERLVFRIASVFEGGFVVEALNDVAMHDGRGPAESADDIMLALGTLVDHHLVQLIHEEEGPRYTMLNTVRRFARAELAAEGETPAIRRAHADWCLRRARALLGTIEVTRRGDALFLLQQEIPNFALGLDWFERNGDRQGILDLAIAMRSAWIGLARYRDGASWLHRALALPGSADPRTEGRARILLGILHSFSGDLQEAQRIMDDGMDLVHRHDEIPVQVTALAWQATIATKADDLDRAESLLYRAKTLIDTISDPVTAMHLRTGVISNLGVAALARGDLDAAEAWHRQALHGYTAAGDALGATRVHRDLAEVARDRGDFQSSVRQYQDAIRSMRPVHDAQAVVDALEGIALALAVWQRLDDAATFLGAARSIAGHHGISATAAPERETRFRATAAVQATLPPQDLETAFRCGARWSIDDAIGAILALDVKPGNPVPSSPVSLTPRERDVLRLLAEGRSDQDIADHFFLSVRTIETHVHNLRTKFGVSSRAAVIASAFAGGLLEPDSVSLTRPPESD
jgi:ATP/maltotriose-dependent transcriptional regulator MalT